MKNFVRRFDWAIILSLVVAGTLLLFRMAYLPIYTSTTVGLALLLLFRAFINLRFDIKVPLWVVLILLASIEVDAVGNLFGLYNRTFQILQFDELSHCVVSGMVVPVVTWLIRVLLVRSEYRLPMGWISFLAFTTVFTFAGFYEVIELWDDKYMHPVPGMRIHGSYDTPNDLQWDLLGMGAGAVISYFTMRKKRVPGEG